tara:strand:- start:928 stop:1305 length:378 start_codon:yes stop_codon:yes gene_type:complete
MEDINIRHFKMINGDDVLAFIQHNNDNTYMVETPVLVEFNMMGGFQFTPWFPFSDQRAYKLDKSQIVGESNVVQSIKESYIKFAMTKRDLATPQSNMELLEKLKEFSDNLYDEEEDDNMDGRTVH